ncbi:MAG: DEAD/DEAH box helicase [FCB group bacterium]|nr:DEAD/DEAH box helicase [FCB group bacterium]
MKFTVDTHIRIPLDGVERRLLKQLKRELTFVNPEYIKRIRLGKSTWSVPEKIEAFRITESELIIPRGCSLIVKNIFGAVEYEDSRSQGIQLAKPPELPFKLRDYQNAAASQMKRKHQGVIIIPCGGGKTVVAVDAMRRIGSTTIIMVHTLDLLSQWKEVLKKSGIEAGEIGNGKFEVKPVTVATIQTLSKMLKKLEKPWFDQWGCLILDESHRACCKTFYRVVSHFPAKYRFGLTATPEREDGLTPLLYFLFGDSLYEIDRKTLVNKGCLTAVAVQPIFTAFDYPYYGPDDRHAMLDTLVNDVERNMQIAAEVASAVADGHTCLVLTGRVEHAEMLTARIKRLGMSAEALIGKVKKADRDIIRKKVLSGSLQVIVATSVADEGLDLPNLSAVFFTFPSKALARILQRSGRVMRPSPGKPEPVIFDYIDINLRTLKQQYYQRRLAYHQLRATILEPKILEKK